MTVKLAPKHGRAAVDGSKMVKISLKLLQGPILKWLTYSFSYYYYCVIFETIVPLLFTYFARQKGYFHPFPLTVGIFIPSHFILSLLFTLFHHLLALSPPHLDQKSVIQQKIQFLLTNKVDTEDSYKRLLMQLWLQETLVLTINLNN